MHRARHTPSRSTGASPQQDARFWLLSVISVLSVVRHSNPGGETPPLRGTGARRPSAGRACLAPTKCALTAPFRALRAFRGSVFPSGRGDPAPTPDGCAGHPRGEACLAPTKCAFPAPFRDLRAFRGSVPQSGRGDPAPTRDGRRLRTPSPPARSCGGGWGMALVPAAPGHAAACRSLCAWQSRSRGTGCPCPPSASRG